jgi:hypothetical protein
MAIRLIHGAAFDSETTRLLAGAYERACAISGPDTSTAAKEQIAKRIIALATRGERDEAKLVEYALAGRDSVPEAS